MVDKFSISGILNTPPPISIKNSHKKHRHNSTSLPAQLSRDTFQLSFKGNAPSENENKSKLLPQITEMLDKIENPEDLKSVCDNLDKLNADLTENKISLDKNNFAQSKVFLNKLGSTFVEIHSKPEHEELSAKINTLFFNSYENLESADSKKLIENTYSEIMKNPDSEYGQIEAKKFFLTCNPDKYEEFDSLNKAREKLGSINDTKSDEYKQARADLLNQEFNILKQEFITPERFSERAKQEGVFAQNNESKPEDAIRLKALRGLELHIQIAPNFDKKNLADNDLVNSLIKSVDNNSENSTIKVNSLKILKLLSPDFTDNQKQKVQAATFKNVANESENYLVRLYSSELLAKTNEAGNKTNAQYINPLLNLEQTNNINNKKIALITLAKLNYSGINPLIKANIDTPELKYTALWAAGRAKNDENFDLLQQELTKNTNVIDFENVENLSVALMSLAEYEDEKYKNKTINYLKNYKSKSEELNELAKELTIKIDPKNKPKENFSADYKKLRTKFIADYDSLEPNQKRWVDKALYPFKSILSKENDENSMAGITVIDDLLTSNAPTTMGIRTTYGFFADTASGVTMPDGQIIIPKSEMTTPDESMFVVGHEFGHHIHLYLMKNDKEFADKIEKSFNNDKKDKFLDVYGSQMPMEYFAEANEAYLSLYSPHDTLIYAEDSEYVDGNTRFKLMKKDNEMYKLMQEIYTKYSAE